MEPGPIESGRGCAPAHEVDGLLMLGADELSPSAASALGASITLSAAPPSVTASGIPPWVAVPLWMACSVGVGALLIRR